MYKSVKMRICPKPLKYTGSKFKPLIKSLNLPFFLHRAKFFYVVGNNLGGIKTCLNQA